MYTLNTNILYTLQKYCIYKWEHVGLQCVCFPKILEKVGTYFVYDKSFVPLLIHFDQVKRRFLACFFLSFLTPGVLPFSWICFGETNTLHPFCLRHLKKREAQLFRLIYDWGGLFITLPWVAPRSPIFTDVRDVFSIWDSLTPWVG